MYRIYHWRENAEQLRRLTAQYKKLSKPFVSAPKVKKVILGNTEQFWLKTVQNSF